MQMQFKGLNMEKVLKLFNLTPLNRDKIQWYQFVEDNHHPIATLWQLYANNPIVLDYIYDRFKKYNYPWNNMGYDRWRDCSKSFNSLPIKN